MKWMTLETEREKRLVQEIVRNIQKGPTFPMPHSIIVALIKEGYPKAFEKEKAMTQCVNGPEPEPPKDVASGCEFHDTRDIGCAVCNAYAGQDVASEPIDFAEADGWAADPEIAWSFDAPIIKNAALAYLALKDEVIDHEQTERALRAENAALNAKIAHDDDVFALMVKDRDRDRAERDEARAEALHYRETGRDMCAINHDPIRYPAEEFGPCPLCAARAEAAKLRVEVDQLKAYGRGMTEECKKLREERDAVVIEPGVKAFATGIGDSEDSTIQFEDTPVHVVERKRKGWWYVQKLNGELFLVHEKNLVRRREEKGGE